MFNHRVKWKTYMYHCTLCQLRFFYSVLVFSFFVLLVEVFQGKEEGRGLAMELGMKVEMQQEGNTI